MIKLVSCVATCGEEGTRPTSPLGDDTVCIKTDMYLDTLITPELKDNLSFNLKSTLTMYKDGHEKDSNERAIRAFGTEP